MFEYAIAESKLAGEIECGDASFVKLSKDRAILTVVDGLGHGADAAVAANTAVGRLTKLENYSPLTLVRECHDALRFSRGAAMGLVMLDHVSNTLSWVGIGNVSAMVLRAGRVGRDRYETLMRHAGIVGHNLPHLQEIVLALQPGDILILATDGVDEDFLQQFDVLDSLQQTADEIIRRFKRGDDDALVLIARYLES